MKQLLLIALMLAASALPALAAAAPAASAPAVPGKVTITGDSFVVDDAKHQATFTGNVIVDRADMKLNADEVVALYGSGGTTNISSFEATGHVKIVTKQQTATGEKAVFDPNTRVLSLTGNVIVSSATGQVHAPELLVDLKTNTSKFSAGKTGGRVTGVFTSQ